MPVVNGNTDYTSNPTRPADSAGDTTESEEEVVCKTYITFGNVQNSWLENLKKEAGVLYKSVDTKTLDNIKGGVKVLLSIEDEGELDVRSRNILIKHGIDFEIYPSEDFETVPGENDLYVIDTSFSLSSRDVKKAIDSGDDAFSILNAILDEKCDINVLWHIEKYEEPTLK